MIHRYTWASQRKMLPHPSITFKTAWNWSKIRWQPVSSNSIHPRQNSYCLAWLSIVNCCQLYFLLIYLEINSLQWTKFAIMALYLMLVAFQSHINQIHKQCSYHIRSSHNYPCKCPGKQTPGLLQLPSIWHYLTWTSTFARYSKYARCLSSLELVGILVLQIILKFCIGLLYSIALSSN